MKRIFFVVVLLIFSSFSLTSFAAGPAYNWTGFYAGLQGGYVTGSSDWYWPLYGTKTDHDLEGGMGGAHVGFNYQTPINIVVGIKTEINGGKISGSSSCPNSSYDCSSEINFLGSTRFRVGYAINRFLPYVAVGVAYNRAEITATQIATGIEAEKTKDTYFGWTPGVGVDFAITNNLIGNFEYAYYDFASKQVQTSGIYEEIDNKIKLHVFKFGLSWKF